jgi:DNA polymerase-3 subunit delta'
MDIEVIMVWNDVYGRQQIVSSLRTALAQRRVAHAYLFCGPEGIGKRTIAGALATSLVCETGSDGACGECNACRQAQGSVHPDIHHIVPDGKSLKVGQMRDVKKDAYLKPRQARYQVFIVENAGVMTPDAANSLLKVLEEPPAATVFILLADNPAGLLTTVVSRCQLFQLPRLDKDSLLSILLSTGISCEQINCEHVVAAAEGIPGRMLSLAAQTNTGVYREAALLLEELLDGQDAITITDRLTGQDLLEPFMETLLTVLRDLLVLQFAADDRLISPASDHAALNDLLQRWPLSVGCDALDIILKLQKDIQSPVNQRLALERALRRLKEVLKECR